LHRDFCALSSVEKITAAESGQNQLQIEEVRLQKRVVSSQLLAPSFQPQGLSEKALTAEVTEKTEDNGIQL